MPQATVRIRVPFHDVDGTGRIHFTAMLRYMEIAEHELMRTIGFSYATAFGHLAGPRVHVACDFRGAVRYDDLLLVTAHVERVGHRSWSVAFTARAAPEEASDPHGAPLQGAILAEGRMTMVMMDLRTGRAVPIPDDLRRALEPA